MLESNSKKIRLGCEIALSIITIVLGVVFICMVADIYYSGKNSDVIYSPEIVKAWLLPLIAPLCLWLLAIIACFVLSVIFPNENSCAYTISPRDKIDKLKNKVPSSGNNEFEKEKKTYNTYEMIRAILYVLACVFSLISAIFTIVYISKVANFEGKEINVAILGLVKYCAPFIAVSFLLFAFAIIYEYISAKIELKSMSKMFILGKGNPHVDSLVEKTVKNLKTFSNRFDSQIVWSVRSVVFAISLTFIILGILNGGVEDVWSKAINICTECIGLG